jgi:DMSO/TMAO reductase YedYZ molybdopterin-dependent catalytic subunit
MTVDLRRTPHRRTGSGGQSGAVRFTRRWFVAGAVALVAALAGLAELLRRTGTSVKGAVTAPESMFGAFPVRSVERQAPTAAPEDWVVTVEGLVETPLTIDYATWQGLRRLDQTVDFHCVEGWSVDDVRWGGVAPGELLDMAGLRPEATHVTFHAAGGVYRDGLPLDLVRDPQTVLADRLNDEPLPPAHGGPLRLVVPDQLGYKSVKWVERLEVTDEQIEGYWEKRGYSVDAPVS